VNPLLRIWAISAACLAFFLVIRGAWPLAVACFLFSPAPVLFFSPRREDQSRLSRSWLGVVAVGAIALLALVLAAAYSGGVPQVHEWRAALRGSAN
jgi:hypothetical protein